MPATQVHDVQSTLIPETMRNRPQWGVWLRAGREKRPYSPRTRQLTSPADPRDWGTYEEACKELARRPDYYAGLGFILTEQDAFTGIDLDACRDPDTGKIASWAQEIVTRLGTYTEVSPSGTGLHLFLQGTVIQSMNWKLSEPEEPGKKAPGIEIYSQGHYLTVTGDWMLGTSTEAAPKQDALNTLYTDLCALRDLARNNQWTRKLIGGDISRYQGDDSDAAYALLTDLIRAVGKDAERIERLFRLTRLHRSKDDEARGNTTWLRYSIAKAIETYKEPEEKATQSAWAQVVENAFKAIELSPIDDTEDIGEVEHEDKPPAKEPKSVSAPSQVNQTPPDLQPGAPQKPNSTGGGGGVKPDPLRRSGIRCLSAIRTRKPTWLWFPYIPRGFLVILAGDTGTGKSTIASLIAARLTHGQHPYTGEPNGKPENVVIATTEDDPSSVLKPRLLAYDGLLGARERPALIVVDPMQEALGGKLDENKASHTRAALAPLLPLVQRYNSTILFLCHLGKDAAEKKAVHRVLGSVDIGAVTRSILLIEESDPSGHYTITHVKSNLTGKGDRLAYRIVPGFPISMEKFYTVDDRSSHATKSNRTVIVWYLARS
jgi:AAA domain